MSVARDATAASGAMAVPGTPAAVCTVLMNGRAGAFRSTPSVTEMKKLAGEAGICVEVVGTSSPTQMRHEIRRLVQAGARRVAVAGGDGTITRAVQELAYTNTALGIIPQGTANNFATALRLPQDLPSALRVLQEGIVREVDLGKIGDRYFTEAAGVGLFADALAIYGAKTNKNVVRAFYAITRLYFAVRARRVRLYTDGALHTERAVMVEAANAFRMAYAFPVAPGAKMTDGQLDVVVVGDLQREELIPYYRAFRAQTHQSLPKITMLRARELRIETRHRMNVHCDDKVVGTTPVTITAQPRALKVLVDRL